MKAYHVALVTRGTGAYAFTYTGPDNLEPGNLCAVNFRGKLELGIVLNEDDLPPATELKPLWPVEVPDAPGFGGLLLELSAAAVSQPDEVAGYLMLTTPSQGVKLTLSVEEPGELDATLQSTLCDLAGNLSPARRKALLKAAPWDTLAGHAYRGVIRLRAGITGLPQSTRSHVKWRKWYKIDRPTAKLLGLDNTGCSTLPGSFLAGLAAVDYSDWPKADPPVDGAWPTPGLPGPELDWTPVELPPEWDVIRRWPAIGGIKARRCFATWSQLRVKGGLGAGLAQWIAAGERVLVVSPQAWILDRLWPGFVPLAPHVHRYLSDAGPSAASHLLQVLDTPGQVVCGGSAAWKLAAYGCFDRVVLIDPTHPQYEPEREPRLDPRLALLLAMVSKGQPPCLDLVELGLSAIDGRSGLKHVALMDPYAPPEGMEPSPGAKADLDPVPLELRQPVRRRLVYFNRLGLSRGLKCMECGTAVNCPQCGSQRVHYSVSAHSYRCPQCGWADPQLRCANCGLATLAAQLPGLEAVTSRPGTLIVQGSLPSRRSHTEYDAVIGTSGLLGEPLSGFWPQEIVYVHADASLAFLDDWPQAVDTTARLASLYDNPELEYAYVISTRLKEQLGASLTTGQVASRMEMELNLRRLANLPPFGCVYKLRLSALNRATLNTAREPVAKTFHRHPGTTLLRLGRAYQGGSGYRMAGYLVNPELTLRDLMELRWKLNKMKIALSIHAMRGPWL